jgi:hypothetical protein
LRIWRDRRRRCRASFILRRPPSMYVDSLNICVLPND